LLSLVHHLIPHPFHHWSIKILPYLTDSKTSRQYACLKCCFYINETT
jgi:hypothetical protein